MGRTWPGMLLAPLLALADQGVAYALVPYGCSHQHSAGLHLTHAVFLLATLACAVLAWPVARPALPALQEGPGGIERQAMMGAVALGIAALSAAIVVALWIPQWVLPPCAP
jgi:hypothetical protein